MTWDVWVAFVVASTVILTIPGPTVMLVVSYALGGGRASGWATVPGVALGDFTAMTISLLGAGSLLAASASLFAVLKFAGAAYLVWLGIGLLRAGAAGAQMPGDSGPDARGAMFRSAYVVTALNPKSIVFFVAFVPQFVDATAPPLAQFAILEATFLTLAVLNVALWAVAADHLRARFRSPRAMKFVNRCGGVVLIAAGLVTAATRRAG